MAARDRRWVEVAGLVLVRQRPSSAKSVIFITLEDETGIANLVVRQKVFDAHRRIVLGAGMIGVCGRIQREGEMVHLIAHHLADFLAELASVGAREATFPLPHGISDELHPLDPRGILKPRDLADASRHIDGIGVKTRNFR